MNENMLSKIEDIYRRYQELESEMAKPEIVTDMQKVQKLARERAGIADIADNYNNYRKNERALAETRAMLKENLDEEMAELTQEEIQKLEAAQEKLTADFKTALLPKNPNDDKDIIMEIRAGAGGEEAALFAADLFRMYSRYAQVKGWQVEVININENNIGGIREIVFEINGRAAYSRLKYERGVHRVQRVPTTESSGRIHTSTATIAVLPKADEVEVSINPEDLRIDIFHSGGAGGQNVNKVATAVRITHLPSGIVATCQDERSQLRNKTKAMTLLRSRLLDIETQKQEEQITSDRHAQVGSGGRSEKIRTYNYPQDRISDHRIGVTMHNLPKFMEGDIDELVDALATNEQAKALSG